jgi:PilZ domain/SPOR domain
MISQERRKNPRITVERLAYIHIEPNNGALVLNVSSEGLGFQSVVPVERNKPLRFSLSEYKGSINACGELVWTDELRTCGGLRFTALSPEARGRLSSWLQHAVGLGEMKPSAGVFPVKQEEEAPYPVAPFLFDEDSAALPSALPVQEDGALQTIIPLLVQDDSPASPSVVPRNVEPATGRFSLLRARGLANLPTKFGMSRSAAPSAVAGLRTIPGATKPRGFSAGFAIGLLLSAIGFFLSMLSLHRVELRESLSSFGKRAEHRRTQTQFRTPPLIAPPAALRKTQPATPAPPKPVDSQVTDSQVADDEVTVTYPVADRSVGMKATLPQPSPSAPQPISPRRIRAGGTERVPAPPEIALRTPASSPPTFLFDRVTVTPLRAPVNAAAGHPDSLRLQMYFDLGKFKDEVLAQGLRDRVVQLGLRAAVLERKALWKSSYQVLVGPYSSEEDEARIENQLQSQGYKPRPFERGSRDFAFASRLSLNGSKMPFGAFTIRWESHVSEAKVQFEQDRDLIATVAGRWIKLPAKSSRDEYVYVRNPDGSKTLVEIRFSGLDRALVFRNTS